MLNIDHKFDGSDNRLSVNPLTSTVLSHTAGNELHPFGSLDLEKGGSQSGREKKRSINQRCDIPWVKKIEELSFFQAPSWLSFTSFPPLSLLKTPRGGGVSPEGRWVSLFGSG